MNASPPEDRAAADEASRSNGFSTGSYGSGAIGELLRYGLALLRRNWRLIAGLVAFALIVSLIATMLDAPRYRAVTSVQINDQSEQVLGDELEAQTEVNTAVDVERFLNTQIDILRSRGLAERVARRLELFGSERFYAAMERSLPGQEVPEAERRDQVITLLQQNLDVDLPRSTRIVRIGFSAAERELSAAIANAFAEEFIQSNLQRRFDSSAYARNFIAEQLDEARSRLEASERELNAYARDAGLIRTRESGSERDSDGTASSVTTSSLMQLNEAANQAKADRIAAEGRWQAEQALPPLSSQAVLANPTVQALMTRRSELEAELQASRERYLADHPTVQQASASLASVNQQLDQVVRNVRDSIRAEYTAAAAAEQRLQSQVERLQGATLAEQDRAVRYNTLAREADTNRSLYDGLLQRYRELNAAAGIANSNLAVIDRAEPPLEPASPNLLLNLLVALVLGGGLAVLVVFVRDQFDDMIRVPEDIEEKVQLPLLGVIPQATGEEDPSEALADPKSAISEAYGSLRAALLYSTRSGLPRTMLVTSAQATEGKSTTSFASAMGFARMGRKVLLVDADLRRPSVHRLIGNENRHGLSSLLVSADPAGSAVVRSAQPNLDVLPSGPIPPNPTELLTAPRMIALLDEFASQYDVVILDSPPVLGLADAPALAALVDGVVFVIEAERGGRGSLKTALKRLRAVNGAVLGGVLTKFDPSELGNRYSEYYGASYYRYDAGEGEPA